MTNRHAGYIITLNEDIRENDAEHLIEVLRQFKGVIAVEPVVADFAIHMATERVRAHTRLAIHQAVEDIFSSKSTSP